MNSGYDPLGQVMGIMQMLGQRRALTQHDRALDQQQQQMEMMDRHFGQNQELHQNSSLLHALAGLVPQQQMIPNADKAAFFKFLQDRFGLPADYQTDTGVSPDMAQIEKMKQLGIQF
jgi:hypothetical protein